MSDIKKLFNETFPAKIAANPAAVSSIGATYQFIITGDDGGEWFIDAKSATPSVVAGNPGGAECTMTLSSSDFTKLIENPQANGMQLYMGGKLKVAGNPMLAMKLNKLF